MFSHFSKLYNLNEFKLIVCIIFILSKNTQANYLVTPKRVVLDKDHRSTSIVIVNTSKTDISYQLRWIDKRQTSNGTFKEYFNTTNKYPFSKLLIYSPSQIFLRANEKQVVRIKLKKNMLFDKRELRSHLAFQAQPRILTHHDPFNFESMLEKEFMWSFSIPVIIRQGKLEASAKITSIELRKTVVTMGKITYNAKVTLNGAGVNTTIGLLKILWKNKNGGTDHLIGSLNNVALYPESASVRFHVDLNIRNPSKGIIKVVYLGTEEYKGITFDESEKQVVISDFKFEIEK